MTEFDTVLKAGDLHGYDLVDVGVQYVRVKFRFRSVIAVSETPSDDRDSLEWLHR